MHLQANNILLRPQGQYVYTLAALSLEEHTELMSQQTDNLHSNTPNIMAVNPASIQYVLSQPQSDSRKLTPHRWKWRHSFRVLVEDNETNTQQDFRLPWTVFTERSEYCKTELAFKPNDPEPTLKLSHHDPAIFNSYIQSVYAAKVVMPKLDIYRHFGSVQALTQVHKLANELGDLAAARLVEEEIARMEDV